ncbi:IclR family transcriptional regulator [Brevibacillus sp. SYSU BS000544]|uniref:IclR family transcriptional regulator n=1 Tax=Brevibacillus sp. SYSU BS000544 TaxID=3416443 RepID=UPI003CE568A7
MTNSTNSPNVRSLERGLLILDCFNEENVNLSLTEISEKTGLSTSTVGRLLQTIVEAGYLQKDFQKKYSLGDKMYQFMKVLMDKSNIRDLAMPVITNLRDIYNETASLYIVQNENRVCIASVESHQPLRRSVSVGEVLPLKRGAVGEVLLAWLPYNERRRIVGNDTYYTEDYFSRIRETGFAVNDGLQEEGVYAIAAPVFDNTGSNVAAISVSGPSHRITLNQRSELIKSIKLYSNLISRSLGFHDPEK